MVILRTKQQQRLKPIIKAWEPDSSYMRLMKLDETALRRVETAVKLSEDNGFDIRPMGVSQLFSDPKFIPGKRTEWVIYPMELEPLLATGKFPMPFKVLTQVQALVDAGVEVDRAYIAHELPEGTWESGLVTPEVLVPEPAAVTRISDGLKKAAYLGTLVPAALVSARAALGKVALASAGLAMAFMLDPVLIGAISLTDSVEDGSPAYFVELASWTW